MIGQVRVIWLKGSGVGEVGPLVPEGHGVERGRSTQNKSHQMPSHMVSRMERAEGLHHGTHSLLRQTGRPERSVEGTHGWLPSDRRETAQLLEKLE